MKVSKLKDILYNHQTLCILAKKRSITTITSPKCSCLQEIINFCYWVVMYLKYFYWHKYIFLKLSHSTWLYRSCERFLQGDWHFIYPAANLNHQNFKLRYIYQVLKFPNQSHDWYGSVHSILRLSWAWSSCYMWKHQMLLTYSNNYLKKKISLF